MLDLTGKIIDFNLTINQIDTGKTNRSFQQQEKRWSTVKQVFITSGQGSAICVNCVNAAPCRRLAWDKESVKCEKLYQPHRTTTRTERLLTWIIVTRQDQCPEGQRMFVRLPNAPNVTPNLPVGARLNPFFGNFESLGVCILGSTNVEGGLHSPFLVKTKLEKVTKNHQLPCTFSQEPVSRHYISLWTKMQSSQCKISGLLQPTFHGSKTTQPLETYSRSEQTKPFGDHQDLPPTRGVGYLNRFQGRLLPYRNNPGNT